MSDQTMSNNTGLEDNRSDDERREQAIEGRDEINQSDAIDREVSISEAAALAEAGILQDDLEDTLDDYTDDEDVLEDFAQRQQLGIGSDEVAEMLSDYHSRSPETSADDVDADWRYVNQVGDESVGGDNPTPDQDIVSDLGQAVGLTYDDDEPLRTEDKIDERDQNRWELNPASDARYGEDEEEQLQEKVEDDLDEYGRSS